MADVDLDGVIDHDWLFSHKSLMLVTRDGLGDQIVAAGLAKWLSERVDTVFVPGKRSYWNSVNWMYNSIGNIVPIGLDPGSNMSDLAALSSRLKCQICKSFLDYPLRTGEPWPRACYSQYQMPYEYRFTHWPDPKPGLYASSLYKQLIKTTEYIVVHSSSSERQHYDIDLLQGRDPSSIEHMQVVNIDPQHSGNIFDWMTILENAREIHLVDSSPYRLCEQIAPLLKGTVYFHNIRLVDYIPLYERDCKPFFPKWRWIEYPHKQWRENI